MKTLFLLRHAKSSWKDDTLPDFERPLNRRGKDAAVTIGRYFKTSAIVPELILCSPAERARETLNLVLKASRWTTEVRYDQRIYEASAQRLVEVVSQIENDRKVAMLVGHNPGMEELLAFLTHETRHMPTCALARISLDGVSWKEIDRGIGKLEWFVTPKDLDDD